MFRKSLLLLASLVALAAAGTASADEPTTLVGGDLEIDVRVDDVETLADFEAAAETDIGTINQGSYIAGSVEIDVDAYDVTTEADFQGNACTSIGSVGGCLNQEDER